MGELQRTQNVIFFQTLAGEGHQDSNLLIYKKKIECNLHKKSLKKKIEKKIFLKKSLGAPKDFENFAFRIEEVTYKVVLFILWKEKTFFMRLSGHFSNKTSSAFEKSIIYRFFFIIVKKWPKSLQ